MGSTSEYKQRMTTLADLIDELKALPSREFQGMTPPDGFSSTVQTGQVASSCSFPDDYVGTLVEIWRLHRCSSILDLEVA
jgi:hypothetical protein